MSRHRGHERSLGNNDLLAARVQADAGSDLMRSELKPVLDEEVQRLPEKYRGPVVLHYLEGRSTDETARHLGCNKGAVLKRLYRARELLRQRLTRRGVATAAGTLAVLLAQEGQAGVLPAPMLASACRVSGLVAGRGAAVSPAALELADAAMQVMACGKRKTYAALLALLVTLGITVTLVAVRSTPQGNNDPTAIPVPPQLAAGGLMLAERATLGGGIVSTVTFSPDGKLLAAMETGQIKLWDVASGTERTTLTTPNHGGFEAMAFAADGKTVASGSENGTVIIWDLQSAKEVVRFSCRFRVNSLRFSPDGQVVTVVTANGTLVVWDMLTRKGHTTNVAGTPLRATRAAVSVVPGTAGQGGSVHVAENHWTCALAPDGQSLAALLEGELRLWDVPSGKERATNPKRSEMASILAFAPNSKVLATGTASGQAMLWDVATGKQLHAIGERRQGHCRNISLAFAADGQTLAIGTYGGGMDTESLAFLSLVDVRTGQEVAHVRPSTKKVVSLAFAPGGAILATGNWPQKGRGTRNRDRCGTTLWNVSLNR